MIPSTYGIAARGMSVRAIIVLTMMLTLMVISGNVSGDDVADGPDIVLTANWYVDEEDYLAINITWTAFTSNDGVNVSYYELHKQGGPYISATFLVAPNVTTVMDSYVLPFAHYRYYVVAVLEDDRKSSASNVDLSTPGAEDQAPTYLVAVCGVDNVMLDWMPPKANMEGLISGYVVYRGDSLETIAPIATVNDDVLQFNDTGAPKGDLFYLIATLDGEGEEYWGSVTHVVLLGERQEATSGYSDLGAMLIIVGVISGGVLIVIILSYRKRLVGGNGEFDRLAKMVLPALIISALLTIGAAMIVMSLMEEPEERNGTMFLPGDYVEFAFYSYGVEYTSRIEVVSIGDTTMTVNQTTIYPGLPPIYQVVSSPKNMTVGAGFNLNDPPAGYTLMDKQTEIIWTVWGLREAEHYTIKVEAAPDQYFYMDMWMREDMLMDFWVTVNGDTTMMATVIDCNVPNIIYP